MATITPMSEHNIQECIIDGTNVLADKTLVPLYGDVYFLYNYSTVLFKNGDDGQKYFLYESDNYTAQHPFDTVAFCKQFDYDTRNKYFTANLPEFIFRGQNLLAGLSLTPWYVDKQTGEVKSWFRFEYDETFPDRGRLHYKINKQKFHLNQTEDFKIAHPYEYWFRQKYGVKIKYKHDWRFEFHDPKSQIYLGTIASYPGAFTDIITHPQEYENNRNKYDNLAKRLRRTLADIITQKCMCKLMDIYLPHKMISCVLKIDYKKIEQDTEMVQAVRTFSCLINNGQAPDIDFYDCNKCASESVCMYKEHMLTISKDLASRQVAENLEKYIKIHGHGDLFPELISEKHLR